MNIFQAMILGIIEGATEYLPISSTFHLIWAGKLLGIPQSDFQKLFEVFIQSGAILAILVLFIKEVMKDKSIVLKVFVSFLPTAIVGLAFYEIIKNIFFENLILQLSVFAIVGIVFLVFEKSRFSKKLSHSVKDLSLFQAFLIGVIQSVSIVPGVSRAGAVILGMMLFKTKRSESAKYSFFLAVPTLLAASVLDLSKSWRSIGNGENLLLLIVGFIFSFLSAVVVVKWFISFLGKSDLKLFGYYRIILSIILIIVFFGKI